VEAVAGHHARIGQVAKRQVFAASMFRSQHLQHRVKPLGLATQPPAQRLRQRRKLADGRQPREQDQTGAAVLLQVADQRPHIGRKALRRSQRRGIVDTQRGQHHVAADPGLRLQRAQRIAGPVTGVRQQPPVERPLRTELFNQLAAQRLGLRCRPHAGSGRVTKKQQTQRQSRASHTVSISRRLRQSRHPPAHPGTLDQQQRSERRGSQMERECADAAVGHAAMVSRAD
jgi:hypothetical protein